MVNAILELISFFSLEIELYCTVSLTLDNNAKEKKEIFFLPMKIMVLIKTIKILKNQRVH